MSNTAQRLQNPAEILIWGRPVWKLNWQILSAFTNVCVRRLVLQRPKVPSWSFRYEATVEFTKALISGTITESDVDLLENGSAVEKHKVLQKMYELQQFVNSGGKPVLPGSTLQPCMVGGMAAEWIRPPEAHGRGRRRGADGCRAVLYLHGGAYIACGINTHRRLMSHVAVTSGLPVLAVEYRLMPAAVFDDILEDAVRAFRHLADECGFLPAEIALAGDSAGGHLALALALHLKETAGPAQTPGAIFGLSPWLDPAGDSPQSHASWEQFSEYDYIGGAPEAMRMTHIGLRGHKYASLLSRELVQEARGLCPILIQVGDHECLYGQAMELARMADDEELPNLHIQVYAEQVHVFHMFDEETPMARKALEEAGRFLRAPAAALTAMSSDTVKRRAERPRSVQILASD